MQTITAQQSRDARRELGLSQANVTKALAFNRQYLSEFETGFSTRLTNAQLKKLRIFYEDKIIEANANGEEIILTFGEDENLEPENTPLDLLVADPSNPEGFQQTLLAIRHLAIDPSFDREYVTDILKKMAINDDVVERLFNEKAEAGFIDEWSERTENNLQQVFGRFAANYVLLRHLQGRPLVVLEDTYDYDGDNTIGTVFSDLFRKANDDLIKPQQDEDEPLTTTEEQE